MFEKLKKAFVGFGKKVEKESKPKGGFLKAITETKISEDKFEELFEDLEDELLQDNVSSDIVEKIKKDLKKELAEKSLPRTKVAEKVKESLNELILNILTKPKHIDLLKEAKTKKPLVIMFVGTNGHGKTTSLAKVARYLKDNKLSCIFAASDTFRAASQEQLQAHADKLKVPMIKHKYGSDPAAVAFDAVSAAKARNIDAVLIDTAGRQHSNVDLMDELRKIKRVVKPDLIVFVGESVTGSDCVLQAESFGKAVGVNAIILTKVDVDDKGGAILSVVYTLNKPILFIGTGQKHTDLEKFNAKKFVKQLLG